MWKKSILVLVAFVISPHLGYGQETKAVLDGASKAMGDVSSLRYSGSGAFFAFGQSFTPGDPWPRFGLKGYTRTIDYETPALRDEVVRAEGDPVARGGGLPIPGGQRLTTAVSGTLAWGQLLAHVAPLGWEHIALTGDYLWSASGPEGRFRPLRDVHAVSFTQVVSVQFLTNRLVTPASPSALWCAGIDSATPTRDRHAPFFADFLGNCAKRSRSVRLCYKNARSVTSGRVPLLDPFAKFSDFHHVTGIALAPLARPVEPVG